MKTPELKDDEATGIKWSRGLRDFIERCLEKDGTKRPGPNKMMSHPFIRKSETRVPQPDLARFVAEVWGWSQQPETLSATEAVPRSGLPADGSLNRAYSLRQAPARPRADGEADSAVEGAASTDTDAKSKPAKLALPSRAGSLLVIRDPDQRTAADRAAAKMREADLGLVGSPTEELSEAELDGRTF